MAITRHLAEMILAEHKFRNIQGQALLLGRQLVVMTPDEAQELVAKLGIAQSPTAFIDYDKTPHPFEKKLISDSSFFSLFSGAVVRACDVSDYEGAEIVFDLTAGVPDSLKNGFDFIYNGSVLDNVFDPAGCIRNVSSMLKRDAVVFHYEGAAHAAPAYLKFTPDWFFDYYAINGFADFQSYLVTFQDVHRDQWDLYEWSPFIAEGDADRLTLPMALGPEAMVLAIAQNGPTATIDRMPLQNVYRSSQHAPYIAAFARFAASRRRRALRDLLARPTPSEEKSHGWRRYLGLAGKCAPATEIVDRSVPGHTYLGKLGSAKFLGR